MGVNLYLLDRRSVGLFVGGTQHTIGTLRRFFKLTEMDAERAAERDAAARVTPSPVAVMVADITELALADVPDRLIAAHLVLGWDEGRGSISDLEWDYLPKLGYAARDRDSGNYTLYEKQDDRLRTVSDTRAKELQLLDREGRLVRHGQPHITACKSVRPYITGFAEAECTFDNGADVKLLFATPSNTLPPNDWFIGKRPMDIERFEDTSTKTKRPA